MRHSKMVSYGTVRCQTAQHGVALHLRHRTARHDTRRCRHKFSSSSLARRLRRPRAVAPWDPMGSPGIPWDPIGSRGIPWGPMGSHGIPRDPMGSNGIPWDPMRSGYKRKRPEAPNTPQNISVGVNHTKSINSVEDFKSLSFFACPFD